MREALSLYELNHHVATLVGRNLPGSYWVRAELAEARERSGHCYMDLVEKAPGMNTPVARASAKCWRTTWAALGPAFERATGERMHAGMKVMLLVHAQFHETYGFSWIVDNIDPSYTLGDMERKRLEIVRKLKEEGVFDLQKHLELPLFCQRVAVVSTATAAGYGDFCNQLDVNDYGLAFHTELFEAVMQGEQVETSVVGALNRICRRQDDFDVVVIIRGGGGKADLSGFDTLVLGENVANFPLPIITGIGHDRDESIIDMVSFLRVKTPTAAAAYLVDHLSAVYARVEDCRQRVANSVRRRMEREADRLRRLVCQLPTAFGMVKARREAAVDQLQTRLDASARRILSDQRHRMALIADRIGPSARRILSDQRHRMALIADRIGPSARRILSDRRHRMALIADRIGPSARRILGDQQHGLTLIADRIGPSARRILSDQRHGLEMIGIRLEALDPQRVLQRGYSITLHEGRAVRAAADLKPGDVIVTRVAAGTVESAVTKKTTQQETT